MWVITGGCQGSKRPKTDRSRAWKLVSGLESAAERPLTAKNCLVDVPAVVLRRVDFLIVDEVVLHRGGAVTEGWDVAEGFVWVYRQSCMGQCILILDGVVVN